MDAELQTYLRLKAKYKKLDKKSNKINDKKYEVREALEALESCLFKRLKKAKKI
ncbi:hypothetical protein [Campylobacter fetus]|uniref:hypothetical protein n=1 Tax=Campylobacter fetus TaxID=196 RepID=UPI00073ACBDA|nr:hypothetical protein [Campylobacter fetus]ALV64633.1 hypothetical protein CFTSP3_0664 [Campylobacter fetus subsp. testudinum Sp3]